ncbi:MAG: ABC transporter ATP-binding protein [Oscillospiraceae bacterium]|nr:ABC transporter ATP-binding protein [Oscillospiraceae bacterium]
MKTASIRTQALTIGYEGQTVVENIELQAYPGQIISVLGPNGAGKTTLIRTLMGQLPPICGRIELGGTPLSDLSDRQVASSLAVVLTERPEPELMRCKELVALGRYPYTGRLGLLSAEDWQKVEGAMALVGVSELADRDFDRISDGQRQRVLLARAICQEPEVLILDEPTSYLDLKHKLEFMQLLKRLSRERDLAVLMSIHELTLARNYSDEVVCLRDGRVDRSGPAGEVLTADYVEQLFDLSPGSAKMFL